jgi:hypothetical protein
MTDKQKKKRVEFAKKHTKEDWTQYIFSDESPFQLYPRVNVHNDVVWSENAAEVPPVLQVTHSPSIQVWGAISYYGKTKLHIFTNTLKGPDYQKVLRKFLLPATTNRSFTKGPWTLVQGSATCHTSKSTTCWLVNNKVNTLTLPSKSPDINVIEKVWAKMNDEVEAKTPARMNL